MFMNTASSRAPRRREARSHFGFTLLELLLVVAIIGILAGILLSALAKSKTRAQGLFCMNNTRQLAMAWQVYADEHNGRLAYNLGVGIPVPQLAAAQITPPPPMSANWANNVLDWEVNNADNTNALKLVRSGLGPYARKPSTYRCPSDSVLSGIQANAGWEPGRVRSYSMNAMIGDAGGFSQSGININNPDYVQFFTAVSLRRPADIFVFVDEHPDSIRDGYFLNKEGVGATWIDLPASYHDGAASFSFADGHAEMHRWRNASTKPPSRPYSAHLPIQIPAGEQSDFNWVMSRTSVERGNGAYAPPSSSYGSGY